MAGIERARRGDPGGGVAQLAATELRSGLLQQVGQRVFAALQRLDARRLQRQHALVQRQGSVVAAPQALVGLCARRRREQAVDTGMFGFARA